MWLYLKNRFKGGTIDENEYLDKKVYVTACGTLQEWVFVKRIVHRKGAKVAKKIMKGEKGKEKGERSAMESAETRGRRGMGKGEKREK